MYNTFLQNELGVWQRMKGLGGDQGCGENRWKASDRLAAPPLHNVCDVLVRGGNCLSKNIIVVREKMCLSQRQTAVPRLYSSCILIPIYVFFFFFNLVYCLVKLQTSFFHLHTVPVKKMACDVWDWSVSDDLSSARWKIFLSSLSVLSINFPHCDFPAFPSLCLDGWRLEFLQVMELLERPLEFPPLPWRCLAFHPEDVFSLSLMGIFMGKKELKRNRHLSRFTGNSKLTSIKQEKCHAFAKHSCEQQPNDIFRLSGRLHTALCYTLTLTSRVGKQMR